jgi:hypothetical protein
MNAFKKYAVYAVIIVILAAAALFVNELEYARYPEMTQESASPALPRPKEEFRRPRQGGPMDAAELAWMIRERIILGVMERMVSGGGELDEYNARTCEYNRLSVSIEYRESDMNSALRLVEGMKDQITRSAEEETISIAMPPDIKADARASSAWRVQKYLKLLGYYPGEITGRHTPDAIAAVKTFEIRSGSLATGKIDERLADELREIWISRVTPASVGFGVQP